MNENTNIFEKSKEKHDELQELLILANQELDELKTEAQVSLNKLHAEGVNMAQVQSDFGKLFYGALEPINGHNIKDRRYFTNDKDMGKTITESFDDADRTGAGVFKRIGRNSWSRKNTRWYGTGEVWRELTQDHVDLIHNGKYSRKDHKEVAQEFLDVRDRMKKIKSTWREKLIQVDADTTIPLTLVFHKAYDENTVIDVAQTTVSHWVLSYDQIDLYPVKTDKLRTHGVPDGFSVRYSSQDDNFQAGNYSQKFTVIGWDQVLSDPRTAIAKQKLEDIISGILKELESLQAKYANRLIVKGIF
jgi:hypothetical protein